MAYSAKPFKKNLTREKVISFWAWMNLLEKTPFSEEDQYLFVKRLQEHPEWMNKKMDYGNTALMIASVVGLLRVVQALVEAGADLKLQDEWGRTSLMKAAAQGQLEVVQTLILAGANVNLQDDYGWTALMWAEENNQLEVVRQLMDHGADMGIVDEFQLTVLDRAKRKGHDNIVSYLESRADQLLLTQTMEDCRSSSSLRDVHSKELNPMNKAIRL